MLLMIQNATYAILLKCVKQLDLNSGGLHCCPPSACNLPPRLVRPPVNGGLRKADLDDQIFPVTS